MKTALVTGSDKGLGFELVKNLSQNGWQVILGVRNLERGNQAISQLTSLGLTNLSLVQLDLMDEVSIKAAAVEIEQNNTQLSLLINNAGIPGKEYVGYETPIEDLKATMQVNFFGTYLLINQLTGLLHQNQGTIVNITVPTNANHLWNPLAYKTSKGAQNVMTTSLGISFEQQAQNILIYAIHPGIMSTDLNNNVTGPFVHSAEVVARKIIQTILNKKHRSGDFVEIYHQIPDNALVRMLAKRFGPQD
ncbi:SDR family NAD(P)-dependent oxidoreductase [Latilactobacillus sakei]|uniref:SDR family NAD(P)-dependent oxidoreductase n=1 Tax=Latilactobacillus sakei TaxID=1599 RepID=UPI0020733DE5|nr:SDR family NAD(P)-dependent oxidoreductase [Latilactobacillus sakei]USG02029.1 hypothetical protein A4W86_02995 [Latilactobacillus sakei]